VTKRFDLNNYLDMVNVAENRARNVKRHLQSIGETGDVWRIVINCFSRVQKAKREIVNMSKYSQNSLNLPYILKRNIWVQNFQSFSQHFQHGQEQAGEQGEQQLCQEKRLIY